MPRFLGPRPPADEDRFDEFFCGLASLDEWLIRYSRLAAAAGSARTYVVSDEEQRRVVGYHALTVGAVEHAEATQRAKKGMPRNPIPVVLLARLAVDQSVQGQGLGAFLLADATKRALSVAETAGVRLLLAHAANDDALAFYQRFGFQASPTDAMNVQLLIKDIRKSLDQSSQPD